MRIRTCFASVLLMLATGTAAAQDGTLLTANRNGGSVSFFDLALGVEIARLPVGPAIPHEVAVSPDGRLALTGRYGGGEHLGHELIVIDVPRAALVGTIDLGTPSRPHSMRFLPDGRRAVVTTEDADGIALVDVQELRVLATFPTGGRDGHMVRLSPDASRAYVTSRGAEGTLSVIFLNEAREPIVIPTGLGAEGLAVTPDGREVWVANREAATISIVDTERLEVVETLGSHPFPNRVDISPAGLAVVMNGGSAADTASYLRVFDVGSREIVHDAAIPGTESAPGSLSPLVQGDRVFVSDRARSRLLRYDLGDLAAGPRVLAAHDDAPDGLAWSPVRVAVLDGH